MDEQKEAAESATDLQSVIAAVAWTKGLAERWHERLANGVDRADDGGPMWLAVSREMLAENDRLGTLDQLRAADRLVPDESGVSVLNVLSSWITALRRAHRAKESQESARLWELCREAAGYLALRLEHTEGRLRYMAGEAVRLNPLNGTWSPGSWGDESEEPADHDDDREFDGMLSWALADGEEEATAVGRSEPADWSVAVEELCQRVDRLAVRGDGTADVFPSYAVLAMRSILSAEDRKAMIGYERVWRRISHAAGRLSAGNESAMTEAERHIRIAAEEIGRELPDAMLGMERCRTILNALKDDIREMMRTRLENLAKRLKARKPSRDDDQQQAGEVDLLPVQEMVGQIVERLDTLPAEIEKQLQASAKPTVDIGAMDTATNLPAAANPTQPKGEPVGTNARMMDLWSRKPESKDWSAQKFATALGVSKSTVHGTDAWKTLMQTRAAEKLARQLRDADRTWRKRRTNDD